MESSNDIKLTGIDKYRTGKIPNSNNFNVCINLSSIAPDRWREALRNATREEKWEITFGDDYIMLHDVPIDDNTVKEIVYNSQGSGIVNILDQLNGYISPNPGEPYTGDDDDQKRKNQAYLNELDEFIKQPYGHSQPAPDPTPVPVNQPVPTPSPSTPPVVSPAFYSSRITIGPIDMNRSKRTDGNIHDIYLPLSEKAPEIWVDDFNTLGGAFNAVATEEFIKLSTLIDDETFSRNIANIRDAFDRIVETRQKQEDDNDSTAQQLRPRLVELEALVKKTFNEFR